MEALSPPSSIVELIPTNADALLDAAMGHLVALGLASDSADGTIEPLRRVASTLLKRAAVSGGRILLAPLRTGHGAWLDVIGIGPAGGSPAPVLHEMQLAELPEGLFHRDAPAYSLGALRLGGAQDTAGTRCFELAGSVLPYPGHVVSGDALSIGAGPIGLRIAVVDALGHGDAAARSALGLLEHLNRNARTGLSELIASAHRQRAADPRGAAVAVLDLDTDGNGAYVGIGNVEAVAIGAASRPSSRAGTIGVALPQCAIESVHLAVGASLLIATDGYTIRWPSYAEDVLRRLSAPLLLGAVLAGAIRRTDDAAVLIVRRTR